MIALRRHLAGIALIGLLLATSAAIPSFAATSSPATPRATTVIRKKLPRRGEYAVVVTVPAPAAAESVSVFVGSQAQRNVSIGPGQGAVLAFKTQLSGKTFTVRTVATGAAVHVTVAATRQLPQTSPPSGSTGPTGSTGATGATGATGVTGVTGVTILSPSGGSYNHLVWSDEFNGPAGTPPNPANWAADTTGSCGDNTLSTDTQGPANASIDGRGTLAITAAPNAAAPGTYTSAQLDSAGRFSFRYGKIEARIQLPAGSGLCSGFWMVGDSATSSCFPQCGELDVMEAISPYPAIAFATLHGPVIGSSNFQQWEQHVTSATSLAGAFHTYGLVWRPGNLVWTIDGVPYASATPKNLPSGAQWVFDGHPFHILLSLAVGGWPGAPASTAQFPATLRVDWVRVYN
jgi:beta-glucanase (GH16 family)